MLLHEVNAVAATHIGMRNNFSLFMFLVSWKSLKESRGGAGSLRRSWEFKRKYVELRIRMLRRNRMTAAAGSLAEIPDPCCGEKTVCGGLWLGTKGQLSIFLFFQYRGRNRITDRQSLETQEAAFFSQNVLLRLLLSPFDANFILGYSAPGLSGVHESV